MCVPNYWDVVVRIPALTSPATAVAIERAGSHVIFMDVSATGQLPSRHLEEWKDNSQDAIVHVDLWGVSDPGFRDAFGQLPIIFDRCQGHGFKSYRGGFGEAYSFYPTKNLGALGDGGAICTEYEDVANECRTYRQYGWNSRRVCVEEGMNSRMDEIQAAVLRVKLPHLKSWTAIRQNIMARYFDALKGIEGVRCLYERSGPHNGHICPVYADDRARFRKYLADSGIETAVHYDTPLPEMPVWGMCGSGRFPNAFDIARHEISLPCYPEMKESEISMVCDALAEYGGNP
jgi:dTDP-4-amino-4,6-dideoxygalactose transaminase